MHEFHVWQLAGNRIIATAHINCISLRDYMQVAEQIKSFFHNEGIHSTTIQPEFVQVYTILIFGHNLCTSDLLGHQIVAVSKVWRIEMLPEYNYNNNNKTIYKAQ